MDKKKTAHLALIDWSHLASSVLLPVAGVLVALLFGGILLLILNVNPITAYAAMLSGAVGSVSGVTQSLVKATPLLLVGLGICIAFRANVINIGGEGQIILGAIVATWFPLTFNTWPGWILIPSTLVLGFVAGAVWGFVPGILKARLKVNEILSTIMMNSIALQFMYLLIRGPLMDPAGIAAGTFLAQSARLPQQAWLPRLVPQTLLHAGAILAVILAVAVYFFLWRTTIGYRIRAVGLNPEASRNAGINVPFYQALSLTLAGGFSGLAGAIEVMAVQHRLLDGITGGYGFTGIVAALLGSLHPLGVIPASIIFGGLLVGSNQMQRSVQVPSSLINVILGMVVLFVSGSAIWSRRWAARRKSNEAQKEQAEGMSHIFSLGVIAGILTSMIRLATPFLYAAIGETFSQTSGVVNLGVDGIMLISAYSAFFMVLKTGNLWLGMLVAALVGLFMGLLMSFISVTLKAEQGISGIGLYMFGLGLSSLLFKITIGTVKTIDGFPPVKIPLLGDIPFIGPILFQNSLPVYGAFLLVPIAWWVLTKTTLGLKIKSVGQNPAAADSLGISVDRIRYFSVCLGSVLAGLAGASLSIALVNLFQDNLTAGQGFIAVALVYFGGWNPWGVLGGALLFSVVNSFQLWMQVLGVKIPSDIAVMLPYLLTIAALTISVNRARQPAALNKPFERGES